MEQQRTHYRVSEICKLTGIPKSSLYDAVNRGEVKVIKLGVAVYVPRAEVERLMGKPPQAGRAGGEVGE